MRRPATFVTLLIVALMGAAPTLRSSEGGQDGTSGVTNIREITLPAGTVLSLRLDTGAGSNTSRIEDPVRARLNAPVRVAGTTAIPAGSTVAGYVSNARRSGKVKGRATVSIRFNEIVTPDNHRYAVQTSSVTRTAPGTKKKDAMKIGIPAAGGAIVGGLIGGKKGAAIGGAAGGGAGTAVVLTTRGPEVHLRPGSVVSVRLRRPLTIRLPA